MAGETPAATHQGLADQGSVKMRPFKRECRIEIFDTTGQPIRSHWIRHGPHTPKPTRLRMSLPCAPLRRYSIDQVLQSKIDDGAN
jgi:hypothetical protein